MRLTTARTLLIAGGLALSAACKPGAGVDGAPIVCPPGTTPDGEVCKREVVAEAGEHENPYEGGTPITPDEGGVGREDAGARDDDATPSGAAVTEAGVEATPGEPVDPCAGPDLPDALAEDTNCDGIDGNIAEAIFVSADLGADDAEGSMDAPVQTIARAMELAVEHDATQVLVASGQYNGAIEIVEGVSVHGGYERGSWLRFSAAPTVLSGPSPVLHGTDIDDPTWVSHLELHADDAPAGESAIAVHLVSAGGLTVEDVRVYAGNGGAGADGEAVRFGGSGDESERRGKGGGSGDRTRHNSGCDGPHDRADGGRGGRLLTCHNRTYYTEGGEGGAPGGFVLADGRLATPQPGEPGRDLGGGAGGLPSMRGFPGQDGLPGADGADGADGSGGAAVGDFRARGYRPAHGGDGEHGMPGGGGGGGGGGSGCNPSGCIFCTGGGGGGGGTGGCGGKGGFGGRGGGASVAIFVWEEAPTFIRVVAEAGEGGLGGRGSAGAMGYLGGEGGHGGTVFEHSECQPGGHGGRGGTGGHGGAGGGGGGGPSFGLVLGGGAELNVASHGNEFAAGKGGFLGEGGGTASGSSDGREGLWADTYWID